MRSCNRYSTTSTYPVFYYVYDPFMGLVLGGGRYSFALMSFMCDAAVLLFVVVYIYVGGCVCLLHEMTPRE